MQIACFGASLVSAYEHGAATYCRGLLRALAGRGHRIRFYEPLHPERLAHRDLPDPDWAEVERFTPDGVGVEAALEHAADADMLIKASGIGVFDDLLDAAVPQCVVPPAVAVYWDLAPAVTLARLHDEPGYPLRAYLDRYDLVLTRYGGEDTLEAFQRFGARACYPAYSALDAQTHQPAAPQAECAADVLFMAHRTSAHDARMDDGFLAAAAALRARRFLLAGCGWDDLSLPPNADYRGYVYTSEHNLYNSSATVVLDLPRPENAALGYAPSARLFEAAGAGACVVTGAWTGLESFLAPGREVLAAHGPEELIETLRSLGPERAAAIGRCARERSRHEHTYERRAAELEALLEGFDREWVDRTAL